MKYIIFVYGSLKKGFLRHSVLENQRYLGTAKTQPKYKMYQVADFPGLKKSESGKSIWGELYEIDFDCLTTLDGIEGVCYGLFNRHEILLSEINLMNLPTTSEILESISNQVAEAYFYQQDTSKYQEAGNCWFLSEGNL